MGMEFWLIPVLAMIVAGVTIFYLVIKHEGGSGARADGHTVVDKPPQEHQKAEWNYYK
ncbi:MAG TPA: hypothetical protein VG938_07575 [Verrucomicrobiae bacterium]|nr:hypothetical protein [Verrucomicrobiae bacterium]